MIDGLPPFPGILPEGIQFLRDLGANNDRAWFQPRKAQFDELLHWPMKCLIAEAGQRVAAAGIPLLGNPERGIFRIYRDVRFSKNKAPYKTTVGGCLSRSGKAKDHGVLYIHIAPDELFVAAGFYHPEMSTVRRWRSAITQAPDPFLEVVDGLEAANLTLASFGDELKRLPKGTEHFEGHPIAPYLKYKSFTTVRSFAPEAIHTPSFVDDVVQTAQDTAALLRFGWAIGE